MVYTRERLELADGDFLDLDWAKAGHRRVAIISHGLEGSSTQNDVKTLAAALNAAGWDALAWNFRGCSGEENRLLQFYHSGETLDLSIVVGHAAAEYPEIAVVGFSLGGNMILKYLGEASPHPAIRVAVAVSAPIDLAASSRALDRRPGNGIYLRRFMKSLSAKVEAKALRYPLEIDPNGVRQVASFSEFDNRFTAPIHGFKDAAEYWSRSSALQFLPQITIPTLLLSAKDDPFLAPECFPETLAREHSYFYLEAPACGGHLGFLDLRGSWMNRRIPMFLNSRAC